MDSVKCGCPCSCGHAHDQTLPVLCTFCRAMATYQTIKGQGRASTIYGLSRKIRETNAANKFDAPTWDNLPAKLMFAVTKLDEGLEAILGKDGDPLVEELADAAIRILDILQGVWGDRWVDRTGDALDIYPTGGIFEAGEVALWRPLRLLCRAAEAWRYDRPEDVRISLELALCELYSFGIRLGVDLHVIMEWRNEKKFY